MKTMRVASTMIELVAFGILLCFCVFFIVFYDQLPDNIPARTGLKTLGMESKTEFLLVFWVALALYGILFILKRFPRLMAYPVQTNADNIEIQAVLAKLMLGILTLVAMAMFFLILCDMYSFSVRLQTIVNPNWIVGLAAAMPATLVLYILLARKFK